MVAIPGSEMLSSSLHVIAQSLLIPVIVGLLASLIYAIINFGGLISEHSSRIRFNSENVEELMMNISNPGTSEDIIKAVNESELPRSSKEVLMKIASTPNIGPESREALARKLIENEELNAAKSLEKIDIVTRLGPTLGLMGTLIPMGPGLAALGSGDVNTLADAIIVAFDTTVVGLAAGGVAYVIGKVRRRWYEDKISTLYTITESVLEVLKNAKTKTAAVFR